MKKGMNEETKIDANWDEEISKEKHRQQKVSSKKQLRIKRKQIKISKEESEGSSTRSTSSQESSISSSSNSYSPDNHDQFGLTPLDGDNPEIYSNNLQYIYPISFLTLSLNPLARTKKNKELPPPPTYIDTTQMSNYVSKNIKRYEEDWELMDDGALKFINLEIQARQKKAMGHVFKRMAKSIFDSDIFGFSVPVVLHEPRSMTERMSHYYRIISMYLAKASEVREETERFKLFISSFVTAFILNMSSDMPFNPLLGETFEGCYENGTRIYIEQIKHHPAITSGLLLGPGDKFKLFNYGSARATFTPNTMKLILQGKDTVVFEDGQTIILDSYPIMKNYGFLTGVAKCIWKGDAHFIDVGNHLEAYVFFDYGIKTGGVFSSAKSVGKDQIEGIIYVPDPHAPLMKNKPKRISDINNIKLEIARISGSWIKNVLINGVNYWNIDQIALPELYFINNPLPSDCRFREDIIWLRKGNLQFSQSWKDAIEIRQRNDQKLRIKSQKNLGK